MANFGRRLRTLRKKLGKSQLEVAEDLKLQQTRISYWERLENAPKEQVVRLLTDYYSVPITFFYDDVDTEPDKTTQDHLESLRTRPVEQQPLDYDIILHSISELDDEKLRQIKDIIQSLSKGSNTKKI